MSDSWFSKIKVGLSKSSNKISSGISDIFIRRKLDATALEQLEEILISADLGPATAIKMTKKLAEGRFDKEISEQEVKTALAEQITEILTPLAVPLVIKKDANPHIILVVGVNGSGKTTTIGKLAKYYSDHKKNVMLVAGDTFRAAAVEQLKIWGERTNANVIAGKIGADASGLIYGAIEKAKTDDCDILLIDTAGRLQNKKDLMAELEKLVRVIAKLDENAPHTILLILDATTGQNAHSQVEIFKNLIDVTGLALTKLDGSAKGGMLVGLAEKFNLPIHAIGIGEGSDDLKPFDAKNYAYSLMGLDNDKN